MKKTTKETLFKLMSQANDRSEKNEKRLDMHKDHLISIEKHLKENPQNQVKQQEVIADAVAKAMIKNQKDTNEMINNRKELTRQVSINNKQLVVRNFTPVSENRTDQAQELLNVIILREGASKNTYKDVKVNIGPATSMIVFNTKKMAQDFLRDIYTRQTNVPASCRI